MRRLILIWFVGSLIVTSGLFAYTKLRAPSEAPFGPQVATRSVEANKSDQAKPREVSGSSSDRTEQFALTISIASSIISAVAALMQTWLTHRAFKAGR